MRINEALKNGDKVCVQFLDPFNRKAKYIVFEKRGELADFLDPFVGELTDFGEPTPEREFRYGKELYLFPNDELANAALKQTFGHMRGSDA